MDIYKSLMLLAVSLGGQPVEDFLGPMRHNPFVFVPWERKASAYLELAQGDESTTARLSCLSVRRNYLTLQVLKRMIGFVIDRLMISSIASRNSMG